MEVNKIPCLIKVFFFEVTAFKGDNTVEPDANPVLEGFKNYYSTLAENVVNMLPKAPNKYSIKTVIKFFEHMIQVLFLIWHLFPNFFLTIL